jgi:DNA polymerase III epsilon subunit-like protein
VRRHACCCTPQPLAAASSIQPKNARQVQINAHGNVLLDTFVRPREKITDFRTHVSGIRPRDLRNGIPFEDAMARVHELLKGQTVVGHALHNDFQVRRAAELRLARV